MTATKTPAFHKPPLFTRQQLIALLLPLIAEQALSVTIGLADTLMVSSVGEAAVSGVSLVDSFNTLMIQIMSALATGGAVVTSQYIGRQEPKDAKNAAAQILFILSSFSLLVAAVVVAGRHAILRGIFGSIDVDVMRYAETYFLLSALSYPFIGLYNAGAALFRAQGNSKISMMSSLVMNVVNIGGNAVLIYGFKMGVMGAALASLVSRAIACVAVLYLLQRPACPLRVDGLQVVTLDEGATLAVAAFGADGVAIVKGQKEPVVQGWLPDSSAGYGGVRPIPTAIYRKQAAGTIRQLYALVPSAGAAVMPVTALSMDDKVLTVTREGGAQARYAYSRHFTR